MEEIVLLDSDFEEVACLNCASDKYEHYDQIEWKNHTLQYRLCTNCSLKYMSPRPKQAWYHNYYKVGFWQELLKRKAYQDQGGHFRVTKKNKVLKQKIANNKRRANRINLILKPLISSKKKLKILEIGAGFGQTLLLFKQKLGASVYAIEPNEETREYLNSISIPLVGRYAEDLSLLSQDDKFDIIITSHVLENLSYPMDTLKMINTYLKDDGLYFIDTTNMYYRNDINPYHMLIYTPESVKNMLNRAAFETVKMYFEDYPEQIQNPKKLKVFDPYLSVVSRKSKMCENNIAVDVDGIKRNQKLGEKHFKKAQETALVLHNRLDRRVVSKLRRIFDAPIPVVLAKEQTLND